jgi:Protein of unknown function (DUF1592)/Protein of unknown function (DUF1588)/Protein of unknown function (DUF1587)/Protein of unknown function (DUF1585)/Protein of unknown function (DUF1595)
MPQRKQSAKRQASEMGGLVSACLIAVFACFCSFAADAESSAATQFRQEIQPILTEYCYDCHGDGAKKGNIAFDELTSDDALLNHDLWFKVLKNVRASLMPPQKKPRPSPDEQQQLERWIKYAAFGLDPTNPDPGRVTVRRLNRVEYRNTIHDLMGIDFNADVEFPPDDTGYGFDNIGDVLTVSPMLLEKYLAAANDIVAEAVPTVARVVQERTLAGRQFSRLKVKAAGDDSHGNKKGSSVSMTYYEATAVSNSFTVDTAGSYSVALDLAVKGTFDFDPGRCRVVFKINDQELLRKEFGWYDNKTFRFEFNQKWEPGEQQMTFQLEPLTPVDKKLNSLDMRVADVVVRGPMEKEHWVHPKNYERFFTHEPPKGAGARRAFARELLGNFASKAFRRPADANTVNRLTAMAEDVYSQPGKTFEAGVAHAMVAVLGSPRFLFRLEKADGANPSMVAANVDEYSLASRLSYFLWSTMPDDELLGLAGRGELRKNLAAQVKRMLADSRSEKLVQNFTGQWLQTRDVEGISIDERTVLARDSGQERQLHEQQAALRALFDQSAKNKPASTNQPAAGITNQMAQTKTQDEVRAAVKKFFKKPRIELDTETREAMRRETEMFVSSIIHEDRPVTELIGSDYTFINEKLAKIYGITNVTGTEMQRVTLPADSVRGGVLTEGSTLLVTSNPDRTSPVKRGLFILENFLGTPTPPPPPNIPALEAAEKDIKDHEPTLREALQEHRDKPLCASCHSRMDPIGLAFENFNAMGMWREKERNQTIDASGTLITGEPFQSVRELKHILAHEHRADFYRCLTEKFLTYALGRGTEYYDVETIDQIVQRLNSEDGRFSALLTGVIESAPFQKMRVKSTPTATVSADGSKQGAVTNPIAQNEK